MQTVLAFYQGDKDQAERLSQWILDLGGARGHTLLLVRDQQVTGDEQLQANFRQAFDEVTVITPTPDSWSHWPESANNVFGCAARHVEHVLKAPYWLWIEPDAVPLREGWLDALQAEYERSGKPFMGDDVNVEGVVRHCSGIAVYPGKMSKHAGLALISHEVAWDCGAAQQIVSHCHFTTLIEHAWKHPTFENWEQVEREVDLKNAVLYHASKDGSLIQRLREHRLLAKISKTAASMIIEGSPVSSLETLDGNQSFEQKEILGGAEKQAEKITNLNDQPADAPSKPIQTQTFGSDDLRMALEQAQEPPKSLLAPWQDKVASRKEIKRYAQCLKMFCTAPIHTKFVRDQLKEAGIAKIIK